MLARTKGRLALRVAMLFALPSLALLLTAPSAAQAQAQSQSPTTAEMVAASARLAAAVADGAHRDQLTRVGEREAALVALKKSLANCRTASGGAICGTPAETDLEQRIAEFERSIDELRAQQEQMEAVAAAMKRIADSIERSRQVADILNGRSTKLAAALGLTESASTVDASVTVDPRAARLVFSTGRLKHCFSTRSVCDAKPYSVSR